MKALFVIVLVLLLVPTMALGQGYVYYYSPPGWGYYHYPGGIYHGWNPDYRNWTFDYEGRDRDGIGALGKFLLINRCVDNIKGKIEGAIGTFIGNLPRP